MPGDRIVGILTPGEGITIYPIQSPDLTAFDDQPQRWLDVRWDIEEGRNELFPAKIAVTAINEPGTLGMIASLIGDTGANIDNININELSADFRELILDIEVTDLKHLNAPRTLLVSAANFVAVLAFIVANAVRWPETLVMLVGAIIGGYRGARIGRRAPARIIRAITLLVTFCITLAFFAKAYAPMLLHR